jgi:lipoprotein-anchoring transpeptidase ErfK/SrfK
MATIAGHPRASVSQSRLSWCATWWWLKLLTGIAVVAAVAICGPGARVANAQKPPVVRPTQELAALPKTKRVVSAPRTHSSRVSTVQASRPLTGAQTVLPVMGHATTAGGVHWLRVMLPGRPNGSKGWITQRGAHLETTSWHVIVRTSSRQVRVYRHGRLVRSFGAVVGKPSTPTPHGRFFVEESVRLLPGAPGGPYALALSARSNVLQEFEGGPGQIAIHGVANLGGTPGTAVSHGCVRLANQNIRWMAARIGPGVPVAIRP